LLSDEADNCRRPEAIDVKEETPAAASDSSQLRRFRVVVARTYPKRNVPVPYSSFPRRYEYPDFADVTCVLELIVEFPSAAEARNGMSLRIVDRRCVTSCAQTPDVRSVAYSGMDPQLIVVGHSHQSLVVPACRATVFLTHRLPEGRDPLSPSPSLQARRGRKFKKRLRMSIIAAWAH
jgi:hypothetical protein